MGEFADYANDQQMQSLEDLMTYEAGHMSDEAARDCGVIDEDGTLPNITTWGVHDANSLLAELDRCELLLASSTRPRLPVKKERVWVSGGKVCVPSEMTTLHLKNAIAYAERNGMNCEAVEALRAELQRR
jgi:hypothetical protein